MQLSNKVYRSFNKDIITYLTYLEGYTTKRDRRAHIHAYNWRENPLLSSVCLHSSLWGKNIRRYFFYVIIYYFHERLHVPHKLLLRNPHSVRAYHRQEKSMMAQQANRSRGSSTPQVFIIELLLPNEKDLSCSSNWDTRKSFNEGGANRYIFPKYILT